MSDSDQGGKRFRKPRFAAPAPGEGEERLPAVSPEQAAREMARVMEPLKGLAEAFQQNTEALRSLAEGQAQIGKRLERTDRSEAVITSTKALNDTFRGVQRTQERLMTRLEDEKKRPWRLLVAGVLGFALLIGGLLWFLLGWVRDREEQQGHPGIVALEGELRKRDLSIEALRGELDRRDQALEAVRADLAGRAEELIRQEGLTREQQRVAEDLRKTIAELEEERAGYRETQAAASRLLTENAGLAAEGTQLRKELSQLRRDLAEARAQVESRDAQILDLNRKLESLVRREAFRESPPAAPQPVEPVSGTPADRAESNATKTGIPPGAMTDKAQLDRLVSVLNGLLGKAGGEQSCEFLSIGGVRGRSLYQVDLVTRDASGQISKRVEGRECRVIYMEGERRAEIRFWDGDLTYYGVRTKFLGNRYVVHIPDIDPLAWQRSGLTILEQSR